MTTVNVNVDTLNKNMKLIIPKEIEAKIHAYVMAVDSEIAGMGKVHVEGTNIIVDDVMIYEQKVTGATADLSQEAIAKWLTELVRAGGSPRDWKLWWHSHHTMSAFFSGRDTATIDLQTESDWLVSLVVNTKREREARIDLYRPFRISETDLDIEIAGESAFVVPPEIAEEVARKVSRPVYTPLPLGYKATEAEEYSKPELKYLADELQNQISALELRGLGTSAEAVALTTELVDIYTELATTEKHPKKIAKWTEKIEKLENYIDLSDVPYRYNQYD